MRMPANSLLKQGLRYSHDALCAQPGVAAQRREYCENWYLISHCSAAVIPLFYRCYPPLFFRKNRLISDD
jgi:hypothetical protein